MRLLLATPIGLPLASFSIFFTLENPGLYPPWSNVSSILTYLFYESGVNSLSASLTAGFSNTLLKSDWKSLSSSASSAHISVVGLVLLGPVKASSVYFSCNISLIAFSYTPKCCLLASVHVYIYFTRCTIFLETGMPLSGSIQYLINYPTLFNGPRSCLIWVSLRPVSPLKQNIPYHPKSRYSDMAGVYPVISSSEFRPCSLPECLAVNCIILEMYGYTYLHSRLGQYVLNISWYHFFCSYRIMPSAGFWLKRSLSYVCPRMLYFLKFYWNFLPGPTCSCAPSYIIESGAP